jgi:hypothetical protein
MTQTGKASQIRMLAVSVSIWCQDLGENGYSFKEYSSFQITGIILLTNLIFSYSGSKKSKFEPWRSNKKINHFYLEQIL